MRLLRGKFAFAIGLACAAAGARAQTATPTETPTATATFTASVTPTSTETPTETPTMTASPSFTPSPTSSATATPSATASPSLSCTATPTTTFPGTHSSTPGISQTPSPTCTPGPSLPELIYPTDGATDVSTFVLLRWTSCSGGLVKLDTVSPPQGVACAISGGTTCPLGPLAPNTVYYWQVISQGGGGAATSSIWSFTTGSSSATETPSLTPTLTPTINWLPPTPGGTCPMTTASPTPATKTPSPTCTPIVYPGGFTLIPNPEPNADDRIGFVLARGANGGLAVGAPKNDSGATEAGSVHLFDPSTGALLGSIRNPHAAVGAHFGASLAYSGANALVGAPEDSTAAVNAGIASLLDGDPSSPGFGTELLSIACPSASPSGARFGVAVAATPKLLLIAAEERARSLYRGGSVYIYDGDPASAGFGGLLKTLTHPTAVASEDWFGYGVEIDGGVIAVFAEDVSWLNPDGGSIHLYNGDPESASFGGLLKSIQFSEWQGTLMGIDLRHGRLIAGAIVSGYWGPRPQGGAFVYDAGISSLRFGDLMLEIGTPYPKLDRLFGGGLSIAGGIAAIAAPYTDNCNAGYSGAVYLYNADWESAGFGSMLGPIPNPSPASSDYFGFGLVALDSGAIAIGVPGDDTAARDTGAVYLYSGPPVPSPTPSPTISATPTASLTPTASFTASATPTASLTPTPTAAPPTILRHPLDLAVNEGDKAEFAIEAVGVGGLSYQWRKGLAPIPGATSNALVFAAAALGDAGDYSCAALQEGGLSAISRSATLTVLSPPAANAAEFVAHSAPAQVEAGATLNIGVTMKNTSALSWSSMQGYSLAVIDDPAGVLGGATRLAPGDAIWSVPGGGGLATFIAEIRAPQEVGPKSARLRMVEEFVEFFGEEAVVAFEVIAPRNAAREWLEYE